MAVKFAHSPRYTVEDYESWQDSNWELIEGVPYAMSPAPRIRHQEVSHRIAVELANALADCEACRAMLPVNYRITDDTIVQPDNLVVCGAEPEEDAVYLTATPALVFEVLSPSTALKDRIVKRDLYAGAGVPHFVLADPDREEIEALELDGGEYVTRFVGREGTVSFDLGPCAVEVDVARLWRR